MKLQLVLKCYYVPQYVRDFPNSRAAYTAKNCQKSTTKIEDVFKSAQYLKQHTEFAKIQ